MRSQVTRSSLGAISYQSQTRPKKSFTKDEALGMLTKFAGFSENGRDPIHLTLMRQWFVQIAYYLGITDFEGTGLNGVDPVLFPGRDNYNANHIQRLVRYQVAQMTSGNPSMSVIPKSPDPDDQIGSKVAEYLLNHYEDMLDLPGLRREMAFWLICTGNAFPRVDWDAMAGAEMKSYRNPYTDETEAEESLTDEEREMYSRLGKIDKRNMGELEAECLSPYQVIIPRGFRRLSDMPYVVVEYERSLDWVWDHHPKQAKHIIPGEKGDDDIYQFWERLQTLVGRQGITIPSQGYSDEQSVRIQELWHVPSKRYPKGLWVRAARGTYLTHSGHPYHEAGIDIRRQPWMRFPIDHVKYCEAPGRFWGMGQVEHLMGPQNDYDRTVRDMIKMRDRLGHPQWMLNEQTEMTSTRNEYGDFFEYSGRDMPQLVQPPALSSMHIDSRNRAYEDLQMISSQTDPVQGQVSASERSGVAIRSLQEKANMVLKISIDAMEAGMERFSKRLVTVLHKFMDVPREVQLYGEFRAGDVAVFSGSDLHGNVNVKIKKGSMMPRSEAEAMSTMLELLQTGVINPQDPQQLEMVYKAIKVDGSESLFEGLNLDKRRAQHENHLFLKVAPDERTGQLMLPDVEEFDDHQAHMVEHDKFRKSDAYALMPAIRRMYFDAHYQKHQEQHAAQMQAAMQQQAVQQQMMAGQGSPPAERGQPSPPRMSRATPGSGQQNGGIA